MANKSESTAPADASRWTDRATPHRFPLCATTSICCLTATHIRMPRLTVFLLFLLESIPGWRLQTSLPMCNRTASTNCRVYVRCMFADGHAWCWHFCVVAHRTQTSFAGWSQLYLRCGIWIYVFADNYKYPTNDGRHSVRLYCFAFNFNYYGIFYANCGQQKKQKKKCSFIFKMSCKPTVPSVSPANTNRRRQRQLSVEGETNSIQMNERMKRKKRRQQQMRSLCVCVFDFNSMGSVGFVSGGVRACWAIEEID